LKYLADRDLIHGAITSHIKECPDPGWIYQIDTNLNRADTWDKSEFKVLIVFLSSGPDRERAFTDCILNNLIKSQFGDRVFVDVCFFPTKKLMKFYRLRGLPSMFGSVSHRPVKDFNLVLVSNSVLEEKINLPWMLHNSGLPLYHTQRIKDPSIPLILMGGASAEMPDSECGISADGKDQSFVDGVLVGDAEGILGVVIESALFFGGKGKLAVLSFLSSLPYFYYPLAYRYQYRNSHITDIQKVIPAAPDIVRPYRIKNPDNFPGLERKLIHSAGEGSSQAHLQVSYGCTGGGACRFCRESHTSGGWRERSIPYLRDKLRELRKWSLSNSFAGYSYNINYLSSYLDVLYEAADVFPDLSVRGFRADVAGSRPDYMRVSKFFGMRRVTYGVEGISERIRNGFLNKSLSNEELTDAIEIAFQNQVTELKLFYIYTGTEEDSDYKEFDDFMTLLGSLREKHKSRAYIRISIACLNYMIGTPLQWEERKSIKKLMTGVIRDERLVASVQKVNGRLKITSRGLHPLINQLLMDAGRLMTSVLEEAVINHDMFGDKTVRKEWTDRFLSIVRRRGIDVEGLLERREGGYIFPGQVIQTIDPSYLLKAKDKAYRREGEPICLATPAKPDGRKCGGCGFCSSPEEVCKKNSRIFSNIHTPDEIFSKISLNRPSSLVRMSFRVKPEFGYVGKEPLFVYAASTLFRVAGGSLNVHSLGRNSAFWAGKEQVPERMSGLILGDIYLKDKVDLDTLRGFIPFSNKEIESAEITNLYETEVGSHLQAKIMGVYLICTDLPPIPLHEGIRSFGGMVKVIRMSSIGAKKWREIDVTGCPEPIFFTAHGMSWIIVNLPLKVSPYVYLSQVVGRSVNSIFSKFTVHGLSYYKLSEAVCRCGKFLHTDMATGTSAKFCERCYSRALVEKIKKGNRDGISVGLSGRG
jgi:radical SAM superfamily enzyme YgiQ (UPF0313 family)